MNADLILTHFAEVVDAPGGVDRLRDAILRLAVEGALVPQLASDAAAVSLMDRINAERQERFKKSKRDVDTSCDTHSLPGWVSTTLGQVIDLEYGKSLPKKSRNPEGSIPVFGSNGVVGTHDEALVDCPTVIVGRKGSHGAVNTSTEPCWPIDTAYFVRPYAGMTTEFVAILLKSLRLDQLNRATAVPGLNRDDAYALSVGLPPLAEQEQIVAKVNELMELCDELESHQQERRQIAISFRDSSLDALTSAETDEDVRTAWSRVSGNWDTVTSDPDCVGALRAAILQLAFHGRLTDREASDGSVSDISFNVNAKAPGDGFVGADEAPFALPEHWRWMRLETLCSHIVDSLHKTPQYTETGYPTIRTADIEPGHLLIEQARRVDHPTFIARTSRLKPEAGDIVYSREGGRYGIAAMVPPNVDICLGQRTMQFRCVPGVVPEYFCWFLNSPLGFGQASADVGGSASPHVNIRAIRKFTVPVPPTEEQQRIVETFSSLLAHGSQLESALQRRDQCASDLARALAAGAP